MTLRHGDDAAVRVLHVTGAMNRGGAETAVMSLFRAVDRTRVQFDFLVFGEQPAAYDDEIRALGGRIFRLSPPRGAGYRSSVRQMQALMESQGPFVAVHAHILHASALPLRAATRAGVPLRIAHAHSTDDRGRGWLPSAVYQPAARAIIRSQATDLVACGQEAGRYLFGSSWATRGAVQPNSVDLDRFRPDPAARTRVRGALGMPDDVRLVGSVARLEPVKNHRFLIEATAELVRRGLPVRLLLVGDGSLRAELEAQVGAAGLGEVVTFLGVRTDVADLLRAMDVFAMPSLYEGLPVVLVEAQATGLPCVVSTAVTRQADLGLGLIRYLAPGSAAQWADALAEHVRPDLGSATIHDALRRQGYDAQEAAGRLFELYGVSR